jgi:hypothetical protein
VSDVRSKVTRRPRSKLERLLDALVTTHEVPQRPAVDLGVHLALSCLVVAQATPGDARDLVRRWSTDAGRVVPDRLVSATLEEIEPACPAGGEAALSAVHAVGHLVADGALDPAWDPEDTRRALLGVPGMTPPRADYLLLAAGRFATVAPTPPAMRVAVRLGYPGSTYAAVARALDMELPRTGDVGSAWRAHQLLDHHGRGPCSANRPACGGCPVRDGCAFAGEGTDPATRLA